MAKGSKNKKKMSTRDILESLVDSILKNENKDKKIPDAAINLMIMTDAKAAQGNYKTAQLAESADVVMDKLGQMGEIIGAVIEERNRKGQDPVFPDSFLERYNDLINRTNGNSDVIWQARENLSSVIANKANSTDELLSSFGKGNISPDVLVSQLQSKFQEIKRVVETNPDSILNQVMKAASDQVNTEPRVDRVDTDMKSIVMSAGMKVEMGKTLEVTSPTQEAPASTGPEQSQSGGGMAPG